MLQSSGPSLFQNWFFGFLSSCHRCVFLMPVTTDVLKLLLRLRLTFSRSIAKRADSLGFGGLASIETKLFS